MDGYAGTETYREPIAYTQSLQIDRDAFQFACCDGGILLQKVAINFV